MTDTLPDSQGYRIGAVARLTGVSPDTLRVWERRYQVITPQRSPSGTRLYSQQDVTRLQLIKQLVDAGQAISTVAALSLEQLLGRVQQLGTTPTTATPGQPVRLLLAGPTLPLRLAAAAAAEDPRLLTVVARFDGLNSLEQADQSADVLLVECPTLDERSAHRLRRVRRLTGAKRLLVVYGFAPREAIEAVEAEGIVLLRFPASWETVRAYCLPESLRQEQQQRWHDDSMSAVAAAALPARRFDDSQLARAGMVSTSIKCECPHHLADLIVALCRFERYSAECENRNAQDAALHAYLHGTTARARSLMEEALAQVLEMEGLDVGAPGS